jgi:hypothetical protein
MNTAAGGGSGFVQTLVGFADFLKYGSIGFAGLMLVLVIAALSIRQMDDKTATLLRTFLFVGAFCFVVSSASTFFSEIYKTSHLLYLTVIPNQMHGSDLPPPVITINNENQPIPLRYQIAEDVTAIVDVNDAVNKLRNVTSLVQQQQGILVEKNNALAAQAEVVHKADAIVSTMQGDLEKLTEFAANDSCPGGPHGVPSNHAGEIATVKESLSSAASNVKGLLTSIR